MKYLGQVETALLKKLKMRGISTKSSKLKTMHNLPLESQKDQNLKGAEESALSMMTLMIISF